MLEFFDRPSLWIARRFSFAPKRFRIINAISAISFAGIVIGVCTLLVVMSVLNGFQKLASDLFLTLDSPVQMISEDSPGFMVNSELLESLRRIEGVASAEPYLEGEAVLAGKGKNELVTLKGLSPLAEQRLMRVTGRQTPLFSTPSSISAGEFLAYRTGLYQNSVVNLFSPELIRISLASLSQPYILSALRIAEVSVSSTFTLQKLFDDRFVLSSNALAREVLLLGRSEYSGIDIRPRKGVSEKELAVRLTEWQSLNQRPEGTRFRTLAEKYRDIFSVMELEKWVSFAVLMLIVLVASLSLTGSLAMTAIDKKRDLFSLRCLGMGSGGLMGIFMMQGGLTGLAGTAGGVGLAWVICRMQELFGLVRLPSKSAFIIEAYPVSMEMGDFLAVACAAILLSLAVSIYPARNAAAIARSQSLAMKSI
ncbi:MAG: FtsX-like permease family protein [Chlorobium phaeovibrioides]|nr:FtsX-like permease family protein [Chlorobium phaeovibrioides]